PATHPWARRRRPGRAEPLGFAPASRPPRYALGSGQDQWEGADLMGGPTAVALSDTSSLNYSPPPPPQGQDAKDNAQWWGNLSTAEQDQFVAAHPDQVGMMDGLPTEVRHEANMATLRADAASGHDQGNAQNLLDRIEASQNGPANERIFLLGYEPPGADGNPDAKVIA